MGENLNYKADSSWCYNNKESNCKKYGRLYDWNTAVDICPAGWHLPNSSEWSYLVQMAESSYEGCKLMSKMQQNGTDDYGWSGLAGGERRSDDYFVNIGDDGYWWVATGSENKYKHYKRINGISEYSSVVEYSKNGCSNPRRMQGCVKNNYGLSIRCVQDYLMEEYITKSELNKNKVIFSTKDLDSATFISPDKYPSKITCHDGKKYYNADGLIKLPNYKNFEIVIYSIPGGDTAPYTLCVVKPETTDVGCLNITPHWSEPENGDNVYNKKTFKIYENYTIEIHTEEQGYTEEHDDRGESKYGKPLKYTKYYRINDKGDFYEVILK
jgi:uncharacterized protein (TIGR02145 family)